MTLAPLDDVNSKPQYEILIIDDNPAEAHILSECFSTCEGFESRCSIRMVTDTRDVIPFLRSPERSAYRPDLFVLDYKMPIDGGLALIELKGDPAYLHIPVTVLTGSHSPEDICEVYRRGANCCYHKPSNLDGYRELAKLILHHWLLRICRPSSCD